MLPSLTPYIVAALAALAGAFGLVRYGARREADKRDLEEANRNLATRKEIRDALKNRDPADAAAARKRLRDAAK